MYEIRCKPCSFNVKFKFSACCLIAVLNSFEPVKYNIVNAYSSLSAYKKSNLLGICVCISASASASASACSGNFPIVKLFVSPLVNK